MARLLLALLFVLVRGQAPSPVSEQELIASIFNPQNPEQLPDISPNERKQFETVITDAARHPISIGRPEDVPWAVYKAILRQGKLGNIFFSPASLEVALGMVYMGARGQTQEIMQSIMHLPTTRKDTENLMRRKQTALRSDKKSSGVVIKSANRFYVDQSIRSSVLDDFKTTLERTFDASLRGLDFHGRADDARNEINSWVASQTNNLIRDLLPEGQPDPDTTAMLVNAVYFNGGWKFPFSPSETSDRAFTTLTGEQVRTPFMTHLESYELSDIKSVGARVLRLPYKSADTSFTLILPDEGHFEAVEDALSSDLIDQAEAGLQAPPEVMLSMPKFKLAQSLQLRDALNEMGLGGVFAADADYSGISRSPLFQVSHITHKATVTVDEKGTEAAAATDIGFTRSQAPQFFVNRPFIFYIKRANQIVFIGRVANPTTE